MARPPHTSAPQKVNPRVRAKAKAKANQTKVNLVVRWEHPSTKAKANSLHGIREKASPKATPKGINRFQRCVSILLCMDLPIPSPLRLYLTTRTAKATLLPIPQQDPPSTVTFATSLATTTTTAVSTRPYATHRHIKHVLHIRKEHSLFTITLRIRYTRPDRALLPHAQTCHATSTAASPHFCAISFNLRKPTLMIIS
jgi:hypothetical protein